MLYFAFDASKLCARAPTFDPQLDLGWVDVQSEGFFYGGFRPQRPLVSFWIQRATFNITKQKIIYNIVTIYNISIIKKIIYDIGTILKILIHMIMI